MVFFIVGVIVGNELKKDKNFVVIDIETTGLNAESDEIISVTAVKFVGGEKTAEFDTWLNPRKPVPDSIRKLIGYKDEWLENAPTLQSKIEELDAFLSGSHIVCHNADFVVPFLESAYKTLLNRDFAPDVTCTLGLAMGNEFKPKDYKLSSVLDCWCGSNRINRTGNIAIDRKSDCYSLGHAYKAMLFCQKNG